MLDFSDVCRYSITRCFLTHTRLNRTADRIETGWPSLQSAGTDFIGFILNTSSYRCICSLHGTNPSLSLILSSFRHWHRLELSRDPAPPFKAPNRNPVESLGCKVGFYGPLAIVPHLVWSRGSGLTQTPSENPDRLWSEKIPELNGTHARKTCGAVHPTL